MYAVERESTYPGQEFDAKWRSLVFPSDYRNPPPAERYNLVVIGAGPAGLIAAIGAAGLGAKVALVEQSAMGGDCLNVGCVPSKAMLAAARRVVDLRRSTSKQHRLDSSKYFDDAMKRMRNVRADMSEHDSVARFVTAGVDVFLGSASFVDAYTVAVDDIPLNASKILIATGSHPIVPPIPGLKHADPLTNERIFDLKEQPRSLGVIGGGPIGCELAQAFARLGSKVELFEVADRLLAQEEPAASALVENALLEDGVRLHLGVNIATIRRIGETRVFVTADGNDVFADEILVAAGRRPNVAGLDLDVAGITYDKINGIHVNDRLQTARSHIFAAGDVASGFRFTHNADAQARIVLRNALFAGRATTTQSSIPRCTYTSPEIAQLGITTSQAIALDVPHDRYRVDWTELDRGRTDSAGAGFAQVLTRRGNDQILGATVVGFDAGEQLATLCVLHANGLGLEALGKAVLPYPTRSEYLKRLADAYNRTRLTPRLAKLLRWWLSITR